MTSPSDNRYEEHGDLLRRALHAEADSIMPAPDGLERIRSKIGERERRFGWTWFTASWVRPAAAAGFALGLTFVAVSAPPAIQQITSAGDQSSAPHQTSQQASHQSEIGSPASSSYPVQPAPPPRPSASQSPSASATSTCPSPAQPASTPAASTSSAAKTEAHKHKAGPGCPSASPSPTPTSKSPTPSSPTPSVSASTESASQNPAVQTQSS